MTPNNPTTKRIELVDALRGFALLAIVLLHNLEHYNLYYFPEQIPRWLTALDKGIWDMTFFLFAGKAFSTFALLFGFSFFVQNEHQKQKGRSFDGRFAWRMAILILFAQFHALFYNGDILLLYALAGFALIPINKLSDRWALIVAIVLFLQPLEWFILLNSWLSPSFTWEGGSWMPFASKCKTVMEEGNFLQIVQSNITDGQLYNNLWQIEAGRLFHIPALFIFGMLLGRKNYFVQSKQSTRFWVRTAIYTFTAMIPLYILKTEFSSLIEHPTIKASFERIIPSIWNLTFMGLLVACFVLLWFHKGNGFRFQRFIIPYGRMSLTNYITQSILGCFIYLAWGLGLYKYTGATATILIGIVIFAIQWSFSNYWLKHHKQGPFEGIWKRLTWIQLKKNG